MSTAACKGLPLSVFFDYEDDDVVYSVALAGAREVCDGCDVREKCLIECMRVEGNDSPDYRAGIYAGLTPQQRHSLHKRGTKIEGEDPVDLRKGTLKSGRMPAIPDRGDLWTERHTKLARMTIGWLMWNVEVNGQVPDALSLSRTLKVGVKDLRRVYQALKEDHVLKRNKDTGKLVYEAEVDSVDRWLPKHLRKPARK